MSSQDDIERTLFPIPHRPRTGLVTYDAKDPVVPADGVLGKKEVFGRTSVSMPKV